MDKETMSLRRLTVGLTVLMFTVSGLTGIARSSSQDLGDVVWPPAEHQRFEDLADLGSGFFDNGTDSIRVGVRPMESFRLDRINATTSRVRLAEDDGTEHTWIQHHEPDHRNSSTVLRIRPEDLQPAVTTHLDPTRISLQVLTLTGPPGSFDIAGNTTEDQVQTLGRRLGFPVDEMELNVTTTSFPRLYDGESACFKTEEGNCTASAGFTVDCRSCPLVFFNGPEGNSNLDSRFRGSGLVLFDDQARMVAATVSYVFDLNESAVLDPVQARDMVVQHLQDRGYDVGHVPKADHPELVVRTYLAPDRVAVREVHYEWNAFTVRTDTSKDWNGTGMPDRVFEVDQDAVSGEILSMDAMPGAVEESPRRGPVNRLLPGPGPVGLVAALVGALAWRRRRSG